MPANQPLLLIVELDPILGVVYATEKDYAHLRPGQTVSLTTDAYLDAAFFGRIDRIAPVFSKSHAPGPGGNDSLKIRDTGSNRACSFGPRVVLKRVLDTTIVPEQALTTRDGLHGVFVVSKDGKSVIWRAVKSGHSGGESRVQVEGEGLSGLVGYSGAAAVKERFGRHKFPRSNMKLKSIPGRNPIS